MIRVYTPVLLFPHHHSTDNATNERNSDIFTTNLTEEGMFHLLFHVLFSGCGRSKPQYVGLEWKVKYKKPRQASEH